MKANWKDRDLVDCHVQKSTSWADCLRSMGLSMRGGNHHTLKKYVKKYSIDTSHFVTMEELASKRMLAANKMRRRPIEDYLVYDPTRTFHVSWKDRLFKEGIFKEECSGCGLGPEWQGKPITLQVDHVDGDRHNHSRQNLRILCPNCHSQTKNWGSKKETE